MIHLKGKWENWTVLLLDKRKLAWLLPSIFFPDRIGTIKNQDGVKLKLSIVKIQFNFTNMKSSLQNLCILASKFSPILPKFNIIYAKLSFDLVIFTSAILESNLKVVWYKNNLLRWKMLPWSPNIFSFVLNMVGEGTAQLYRGVLKPGKPGNIGEFWKKKIEIRENCHKMNVEAKFVNLLTVNGTLIILFLKSYCKLNIRGWKLG